MREDRNDLIEVEKAIQEEIDRYDAELISLLVSDSPQTHTDWADHEIAMVCLRGRKICLCLESGQQGKAIEEIDLLLNSVKRLEYSSELTPDTLSDACDCVLSMIEGGDHTEALKILISEEYGEIGPNTEISEDLFFMLTNMASYFESHQDIDMVGRIITHLVSISAERNKENTLRHREIVVKSLSQILEICPDESYVICNKEKGYFKGIHDEYTSDFLWFSGCLLQRKNNTKAALAVFKNCYNIRLELYGEQDWYTALARREYAVLHLALAGNEDNTEELSFLNRFINCVEEGSYSDIDRDTLKIVEGKTLYVVLLYKLNHEIFHSYEHLHSLYYKICEEYNEKSPEPLIKLRLSYNLIGGFYLKRGKYIRAEQAFVSAVNAPFPANVDEILSIAQMKSNLLMVYYVENDMPKAAPLILELLELIEQDGGGIEEKDQYRILTMYNSLVSQAFLEIDKEEVDFLISELDEIGCQIKTPNENCKDPYPEKVIFFVTGVQLLLQNDELTPRQCNDYCDALAIVDNTGIEQLEQGQRIVLWLILSILAWEVNRSDLAECTILKAARECWNSVIPLSTKASIFQTAASILGKCGKEQEALKYLNHALLQIRKLWHSYLCYSNDNRLLQILSPTQLLFTCSYAIMRTIEKNTWKLYERVINYKALASLAGKERNRTLNSGYVDAGLIGKIKSIQDRLAAIETEGIFLPDSNEYDMEKENLRVLEAEFAARFPERVQTKDITVRELKNKLPDNSVLIEYILCPKDYGVKSGDTTDDTLELDAFVVIKNDGQCTINRCILHNAESIIDDASEIVQLIVNESRGELSIEQMEKKEHFKRKLYSSLISPIYSLIADYKKLFIAPDADILNLPFDVLADGKGELLGDYFNIVVMESGRDFLYSDSSDFGSGSLIVGNPQFDVPEKQIQRADTKDQDRLRFVELKPDTILQLPFSEFEARMVSKYCKSKFLVGKQATRYQLQNGIGKRNIHLATHGYFDLLGDTDSIYSSCLLFSGVCNWLRKKEWDSNCGNGILTADEISRYDYHNVELVVLSSCLGGMNDIVASKGFQGLIGGFSASGVKYVISNIWNADDMATAILMDAFYYQYCLKKVAPPVALKRAKQYLRTVTIGDLKRRNWFEYILQGNILNSNMKMRVSSYVDKNERFRPFKNEIYWSGFTCFRCN